ncbi:uncharacterized protein [Watersipora subatra]|uniref:uncharacterized protein n=1 Tax=Watersipora subatra TaxID=2589382 RepID=UPI00355B386B
MAELSRVFYGGFWFTTWTLFSFCAHLFARTAIQSSASPDISEQWMSVLLLTLVQLVVGAVVLRLAIYLLDRGVGQSWVGTEAMVSQDSSPLAEEKVEPCRISLYTCHALATLATNASIAFVNTGSAFTIKAFEPITTAVLTSMLIGTKLQSHIVVSLPLVVMGAVGFVWQPSLRSGALYGLSMAFVSNILFGVRNINLKMLQRDAASMRSKLEILQTASMVASGIIASAAATLLLTAKFPFTFGWMSSLFSAAFHVTYTIISTCVILKYTSVVGHATFNLLKRILVALTFFLIGQTIVSSTNWLLGGVMLIGLIIYLFPKLCRFKDTNASLSLVVVVTAVVILFSVLPPLSSPNDNQIRVKLPPLAIKETLQQRHEVMSKAVQQVGDVPNMAINAYKNPTKANSNSIRAKDTNTLIKAAYEVHQQVFTHIIGKYKKAVLVNVFQWFNKGDHLITIGQRRILQRMGIELIYHCFYPGRECDFSKINKDDPELVVLIQGAGYIGHPSHEFVTTITVEGFPNNRIMVFPISVCHPIAPCTEIEQFAAIFGKHKDVHVVLRDRYSYDLAEQYFKNTHNYLAPDSAFAVGSIRMNIVPVYDIIWLKRNDWESQNDAMPEFPANLKVQVTDWSDEWMGQQSSDFWEDHQLRTMTGIAFLARGKVVISDRLHAHIMSQLMGKLNVVINSETKKQEHYYMTWEQSIKTSVLVNNNVDALREALKLLEQYDSSVTLV